MANINTFWTKVGDFHTGGAVSKFIAGKDLKDEISDVKRDAEYLKLVERGMRYAYGEEMSEFEDMSGIKSDVRSQREKTKETLALSAAIGLPLAIGILLFNK